MFCIKTKVSLHFELCRTGRWCGNIFDIWQSLKKKKNKMVEDWVDTEYISLPRYIRNTPSDTEAPAEYQLRMERST